MIYLNTCRKSYDYGDGYFSRIGVTTLGEYATRAEAKKTLKTIIANNPDTEYYLASMPTKSWRLDHPKPRTCGWCGKDVKPGETPAMSRLCKQCEAGRIAMARLDTMSTPALIELLANHKLYAKRVEMLLLERGE